MRKKPLNGILLDESEILSLDDLCHACSRKMEWVVELVDEGIIEPIAGRRGDWLFPAASLPRAHVAMRLQRDLEVNIAGAALVLDLLDEVDMLRTRLRAKYSDVCSDGERNSE